MFTVCSGTWDSITLVVISYIYTAHTSCQSCTLFLKLQNPRRYILLFPFYLGEMETNQFAKDYVAENWKCCFNLETLAGNAGSRLCHYTGLSYHISIDEAYCA